MTLIDVAQAYPLLTFAWVVLLGGWAMDFFEATNGMGAGE